MSEHGSNGPRREKDWRNYELGSRDINDHVITLIHARCPEFVIYFCGGDEDGRAWMDKLFRKGKDLDLYYECTDALLKRTPVANACLAQINRLVTSEKEKRRETLECVADAFEMLFCEQRKEAEAVLKDIVTQLEVWRETRGRLYDHAATLVAAVVVWILLLTNKYLHLMPELDPWLLAAALGVTGGFFSVCLNLASIRVNVNQSLRTLSYSGSTRAAVALIAGVACLLAVRGKVILGQAATDAGGLEGSNDVSPAIMFFLFLAGFSETFIPNVLRDPKQNTATKKSGRKTNKEADKEDGSAEK